MSSSLTTNKDGGNNSTNLADGKISENIESGDPTWLVGDIVWSKIPGHPWWPSMIAYEPNAAIYYKYTGRTRYYHVQFFGHEPMRGWPTEKNIRLYEGKEHFISLRLSTHGKMHKVGSKQLPLWETAVKMADKAVPLNRNERKLCFTFKYNKTEGHQGMSVDRPYTEILNGFGKTDNETEIAFGEPKTKKKSKISENGTVSGKQDSQPVAKKSKVNDDDKVTKVKQRKKSLTKQKQSNEDDQNKESVKLKMKKVDGVSPATGKRKRGKPCKDNTTNFVIVNGEDEGVLDNNVKKQKMDKNSNATRKLSNNNMSIQQEKSDDSNSTTGIDLEAKTDIAKIVSKQKETLCVVCEQPENLIFCKGICNSAYHLDCLGLNCSVPEKFVCDECTSGNHTCFLCRKTTNVVQCSAVPCGKFYHIECIEAINVKVEDGKFTCPLHYCNVCGPTKAGSYKKRLTYCTRCPTAYHAGTCIVAGCLPITSQALVCKRHFLADKRKAHHSHVNVNWCFVCSIGGTLICCESCPAAFHAECIEVDEIPEGLFFCRDCTTGKELLYGEIVWVKLGMYRWWPAQICNPNDIPTNIQNLHHQPGEFPVQFLGSHDYYWIHRGRVFSYQEGDKGSCTTGGKYLGSIFKKGLLEASEKYAEWQKLQDEKAEKDLEKLSKKPAVYKHLKVNRYTTATRYFVDESEWSVCECLWSDENPCGPDSHCLNRILMVECSPSKCPAKEKCQNQCFVKRQHLECEPFRSKGRGWGLKAMKDGIKGQFIIEYVGELISDVTCRERVIKGCDCGIQNYYMLTIDKDCIIDAGPMGNLARFMNHSCDPNCETQKWTVNGEVRVGLFAKRDIVAGSELVFDYQLDCLGNEKKKCSCGSQNCSGFLGVRPKTQHAQLQEDKKKNQDLKKKKKKTKKNQVKLVHEDECFNCGDGGELIMCDKTGCSKCYHFSCLTMEKKPYGYWICPWHFCDDCGKAAMLRCCECSNSFCTAHADGQITKLENDQYMCLEHPSPLDIKTHQANENSDLETSSDPKKTKNLPKNSKQDAKMPEESSKNLNIPNPVSNNPAQGFENLEQDSENLAQDSENLELDSENPEQDSDNLKQDSENPAQDSENPAQDSENPAQDSENPEQDSENPAQDSENPAQDSENPAQDSENLGQDSENPAQDSENLGQDSGNPEQDSENPAQDSENSAQDSENLEQDSENPEQDTENLGQHSENPAQDSLTSNKSISQETAKESITDLNESCGYSVDPI